MTDVERRVRRLIVARRRLMENGDIGSVDFIRADSVQPANVDWLWPGWLAKGKLQVLAGFAGTGKTTLAISLAAAITSGEPMPCGARPSRGSVLMWSGEDDLADTLVPRFLACGGDAARLHFVGEYLESGGGSVQFDPAKHMLALARRAALLDDLRLLIIDPVVSVVAGDSHRNSEVRRGLQPLIDLAQQYEIAVLGISHFSKHTSGRDPIERVTGSLAFVAGPRLVMVTGRSSEAPERCRLIRAKANNGPDGDGFEYQLERVPLPYKPDVIGQRVAWGEAIEGSARQLLEELEAPDEIGSEDTRVVAAQAFLGELLAKGPLSGSEVRIEAERAGLRRSTLRRAKKELGVTCTNTRGEWYWSLPDHVLKPEPMCSSPER